MYLDGVVTVHCPIAKESEKEYLNLHKFECTPPKNIDFYSCYSGKKYTPSTDATAESILNQALYGFDYTELIENAWNDGVRIFIEMGPGSSCTRAVSKILASKPHLAVSLSSSSKDDDEEITLYKALDTLFSSLTISFENSEYSFEEDCNDYSLLNKDSDKSISLPNGEEELNNYNESPESSKLFESGTVTADAHFKFLEFSQKNMFALEKQFSCLTQIASQLVSPEVLSHLNSQELHYQLIHQSHSQTLPLEQTESSTLFDRNMCMEFATGLASNVLGDSFKVIDTYPVRVRLPDEPLMLVDRIMDIQGEMLSLKSGKIITQHDVKPDAWYLDGGKAPVSISIEAGQADLFLCSWLGIDHVVKGRRRYRLLDAKVTFHRTLPEPTETIEYHIEIERFLKQGDIYLFFFHYQGFINVRNNTSINPELLISMRDGCAGFFTLDEVKNSGGIILKKEELDPVTKDNIKHYITQKEVIKFLPLIPVYRENYTDEQVEQLRVGNLNPCFGKQFDKILLGENLRLPGIKLYQNSVSQHVIEEKKNKKNGRMHLIDRVLELDPNGGRFGMGFISAEADIHPDDWFLTCHFVDDMVMPGTLMYECCAHALRIFTQRIGWVTTRDEPFYDIIQGVESDLKCRGPVTTETKKARYEIEIKEIGYKNVKANKEQFIGTIEEYYEPYIIADAHMFSDEHRIVLYKNMGMRIVGLSKKEIELFWNRR
ncbi:beta keto-acyl synthase [Candidatus Magnetoovum chiemensis]|nr:beta keto-acyl synthase [Candidatus Magnetoovum chiemensis]